MGFSGSRPGEVAAAMTQTNKWAWRFLAKPFDSVKRPNFVGLAAADHQSSTSHLFPRLFLRELRAWAGTRLATRWHMRRTGKNLAVDARCLRRSSAQNEYSAVFLRIPRLFPITRRAQIPIPQLASTMRGSDARMQRLSLLRMERFLLL